MKRTMPRYSKRRCHSSNNQDQLCELIRPKPCAVCPAGATGAAGAIGPTGATGATGATGPVAVNAGTIIPYGSGLPIGLEAFGFSTLVGLLGFGSSIGGVPVSGSTIDLTTVPGLREFAFSVPRAGTLDSLSAYFSVVSGIVLGERTVQASIYRSTAPNDIFTRLNGTLVNLSPTLIGPIVPGTVLTGFRTGINIAVTPETCLLLVFDMISDTPTGQSTLIGYGRAGLNII